MFQLFILLGLYQSFHEFISCSIIIKNVRCMECGWCQNKQSLPYLCCPIFPQLFSERVRSPEDISSSTYLKSVIDDIFGMESIVEAIEVSPGKIIKSISIASILDSVYEFGCHEKFFSEDNWARANLKVENACASAMQIYKDPSDGFYRIWCSCCKGHISSSESLQFNSLYDAFEESPNANISLNNMGHWFNRKDFSGCRRVQLPLLVTSLPSCDKCKAWSYPMCTQFRGTWQLSREWPTPCVCHHEWDKLWLHLQIASVELMLWNVYS